MNKNVTYDWQPSASDAVDVKNTKMLDVTAKEKRDEGPNVDKQHMTKGGKPKGPFGTGR